MRKLLYCLLFSCIPLLGFGQILEENFNDISTLPGAGWTLTNQSSPLGSLDWFQGNGDVFPAHQGSPTAYIAANFNSTSGNGTISNWMITPEVNVKDGDVLSFWTRTAPGSIWNDRLEVRSSGGSMTLPSGATGVGSFTNVLLIINDGYNLSYPEVWTKYEIVVAGVGSTPTAQYFAFRYNVLNGGPSGTDSNFIGIDTLLIDDGDGGTGTFPDPYCDVTFPSGIEPISLVQFAGIDNPSSPATAGAIPLEDFTSIVGNVNPGDTYTITVQGNTNGPFTTKVNVFIDWNQDGVFDPATEGYTIGDLFDSTGADGKEVSTDITVPADALPGNTRMRVMKRWSAEATPCNDSGYGQAEDYTLNVSGGSSADYCIPAGTNPSYYIDDFSTSGGITNIDNQGSGYSPDGYGDFTGSTPLTAEQGTQISFEAAGPSTFGFRIWIDWDQDGEFDASDVVWNSGSYSGVHTGNFYIPPTAPVGTTRMRIAYHWLNSSGDVDPCATDHSYGEFEDYTVIILEGDGGAVPYCIPEATNDTRFINDFSTTDGSANITNLNTGFSAGGYGDFYDTHNVTQEAESSINFESVIEGGTAGFRIWVDWNQDGIFSSDEVAWHSTTYASEHSGSFTVPSTALNGETRMRIVSHWLSTTGDVDPCVTGFVYGEFEDYKFTVINEGSEVDCEIICPEDIEVSTSGSSAVVNYDITFSGEDCGESGPVTITQNLGAAPITEGIDCSSSIDGTTGGSLWRAYDNLPANFQLNAVEFGLYDAGYFTSLHAQVFVYAYTGAVGGTSLDLGAMTLIGQSDNETFTTFGMKTVNLNAPVVISEGTNIAVEVRRPAGDSPWSSGVSDTGETAPGYLSVTVPGGDCGIDDTPQSFITLGLTQNVIQKLHGEATEVNIVQTSGLASGSEFPLGTTTNCFELQDADGNVIDQCCFDVVVVEGEEDCTITCPEDIEVTSPGGAVVVDYLVEVDCDGGTEGTPYSVTQNIGDPVNNSSGIDCQAGGIASGPGGVMRAYTNDSGQAFSIHNVDIAGGSYTGNNIRINVYLYTGAMGGTELTFGDMTLVGQSAMVPAQIGGFMTIDLNSPAVIPAGANYVVEQWRDTGQAFLFGFDDINGETASTYIWAYGDCGIDEPASLASIGFGQYSVIQKVNGFLVDEGGAELVQTSGLPSGSEFPVGTTTNCFELRDADGNVLDQCCFDVTVTEDEGPEVPCEYDIIFTVEPITHVVFAGIDNTSSPTIDGSPALEDFTHIEGNVDAGGSYEIALEGNTGGAWTNFFTVFIKWNAGSGWSDYSTYEIGSINNSTGTDGQQAVGNITIPAGTANGNYIMRVVKNFNEPALDPCAEYFFGQAEDYTLVVGEGGGGEECWQGIPSVATVNEAYNIFMPSPYRVAEDFTVDADTLFTMNRVTFDTNQQAVPNEAIVYIYEDLGGQPGAVIHTLNFTDPDEWEIVGSAFGDPIYHMVYDLTTPLEFGEGTYWIGPKMDTATNETVWWPATNEHTDGAWPQRSEDDGLTWVEEPGLSMVFTVEGHCATLGIGDLSSFDFSYYPNPVRDVLYINSAKNIENVRVFNLTGQEIISNSKVSNGQVDVNALPTGVYVFRVMLEGGQVETFKIIKR